MVLFVNCLQDVIEHMEISPVKSERRVILVKYLFLFQTSVGSFYSQDPKRSPSSHSCTAWQQKQRTNRRCELLAITYLLYTGCLKPAAHNDLLTLAEIYKSVSWAAGIMEYLDQLIMHPRESALTLLVWWQEGHRPVKFLAEQIVIVYF